jgi:protein-tyrosine phosphatase
MAELAGADQHRRPRIDHGASPLDHSELDCSVNSRDGGSSTYNRSIDVLILCTANQCRSPMAEALLRHRLQVHGVPAGVSSAGLLPPGSPATAEAVAVMAARGLPLQEHRSRKVDRALLAEADLVLAMTREHVREVAVLDPPALARTFTLKELVRAGWDVGPRRPGETLAAWLDRVGAGRRREALLGVGHDPDYDVEDPVGRPRGEYEQTAQELEHLLERVVALVWPPGVLHASEERTA